MTAAAVVTLLAASGTFFGLWRSTVATSDHRIAALQGQLKDLHKKADALQSSLTDETGRADSCQSAALDLAQADAESILAVESMRQAAIAATANEYSAASIDVSTATIQLQTGTSFVNSARSSGCSGATTGLST